MPTVVKEWTKSLRSRTSNLARKSYKTLRSTAPTEEQRDVAYRCTIEPQNLVQCVGLVILRRNPHYRQRGKQQIVKVAEVRRSTSTESASKPSSMEASQEDMKEPAASPISAKVEEFECSAISPYELRKQLEDKARLHCDEQPCHDGAEQWKPNQVFVLQHKTFHNKCLLPVSRTENTPRHECARSMIKKFTGHEGFLHALNLKFRRPDGKISNVASYGQPFCTQVFDHASCQTPSFKKDKSTSKDTANRRWSDYVEWWIGRVHNEKTLDGWYTDLGQWMDVEEAVERLWNKSDREMLEMARDLQEATRLHMWV